MTHSLRLPIPVFRSRLAIPLIATLLLTGATAVAFADDAPAAPTAATADGFTPVNADGQVEVVLKGHVFTPSKIVVPAGKAFQILLKNEDATADEFDSSSLKVEKVVGGGTQGIIRIRPLDPGDYPFMGEFNPATAEGVVTAK